VHSCVITVLLARRSFYYVSLWCSLLPWTASKFINPVNYYMKNLHTLIRKAYYKLLRKQIVRDLDDFCTVKNGRALLYYKTDSLVFRSVANNPSHVNHWEIIEIVRVLNRLGFVVDVIDRTVKPETIEKVEDKYKVFIGIGAGILVGTMQILPKKSHQQSVFFMHSVQNLTRAIVSHSHAMIIFGSVILEPR
jgi:hypothetical protein